MCLQCKLCRRHRDVKGDVVSDAGAIIEGLREHFRVETDAALARALSVDKSTISSWRNRDRVPKRYAEILVGGDSAGASRPPRDWPWADLVAFDLALLRFTRAMGSVLDGHDPLNTYGKFQLAASAFWRLKRDCRAELNELLTEAQAAGAEDAHGDAYGEALRLYFKAGQAALEADRKLLIGWLPDGVVIGEAMSLPDS